MLRSGWKIVAKPVSMPVDSVTWTAQRPDTPLIIAHRGASQERPENTLSAFRLAIQQGADGLEFDVHLSADGVPVIIHDATLERTTNGMGKVAHWEFKQLQELDAGDGNTIPSLEQVFREFGGNTLYNIELKNYSLWETGNEKRVNQLVQRFQLEEQVLISSFQPSHLRRYKKLQNNTHRTLTALVRYKGFGFTRFLYQGEADHPWYKLIDEGYMRWAVQHHLRVHAWTVDELDEARRLVNLGVHGLITNRPGYLQAHL